jgi:hypothetical protein
MVAFQKWLRHSDIFSIFENLTARIIAQEQRQARVSMREVRMIADSLLGKNKFPGMIRVIDCVRANRMVNLAMTEIQGHLFPLPQPVEFEVTEAQKKVLDWLAFNDGAATGFPLHLSRMALRNLIEKGLVRVTPGSPARYQITEIGRMVRLSTIV